jgi:hypothetical protein
VIRLKWFFFVKKHLNNFNFIFVQVGFALGSGYFYLLEKVRVYKFVKKKYLLFYVAAKNVSNDPITAG